jgi:uncharacterized protein
MEMQIDKFQFERLKVREIIFAYIITHILVGFALNSVGLTYGNPAFIPILYSLGIVITCFWVMIKCGDYRISVSKVIGKIPEQTKWFRLIGVTFLTEIFSFGSILIIIGLITLALPESVRGGFASQTLAISKTDTLFQKSLLFFATVMIAPVAEEFLFRGIILNRWIKKWGVIKGLIASSILFGCLHAQPIGLSMFALVMSVLYLKSRTLWIPIFCHVFNNSFVQLAASFGSSDTKYSYDVNGVIGGVVISIVLTVIVLVILLRFIRKNIPDKYVQEFYSVQELRRSPKFIHKKPFNIFIRLVLAVGILNAIVQISFAGNRIYRDNFSSDPYRYISSDLRTLVNANLLFLESSISEEKIEDSLRLMEALAGFYELEAKSNKDSNESKLLLRKAQEIRNTMNKISTKSIPLNSKIIEIIRS